MSGGTAGAPVTFESALLRAIGRTGIISAGELEEARRQSASVNLGLRDVLVASGRLAEDQVNFLVGEELDIPHVHLSPGMVDHSLVRQFPAEVLRKACALPLMRDGNAAVLAIADPTDVEALAALASVTPYLVRPVIGSRKVIMDILAEVHRGGDRAVADPPPEGAAWDTKSEDPSGVIFLYHHLDNARKEGATEVHIEPGEKAIRVRYRFGEGLREVENQPLSFLFPALARVRILAGLPAGGDGEGHTATVRTRLGNRKTLIDITITPTPFGESAVIRFRGGGGSPSPLSLGIFSEEDAAAIREAITGRGGLVLVCSPESAVRKEVVYSLLAEVDGLRRKICTVEREVTRPVETYLQATDPALTSRSTALALASSPDVLYLEDIWDPAGAAPALEAALGGLVLVTGLPYPGALEGLVHLSQTGVPSTLLGRALLAAIGLRARGRPCGGSLPWHRPGSPSSSAPSASLAGSDPGHQSGYEQSAIGYETIFPTPSFRELLGRAAPWAEVADLLHREGWTGLLERRETSSGEEVAARGEAG